MTPCDLTAVEFIGNGGWRVLSKQIARLRIIMLIVQSLDHKTQTTSFFIKKNSQKIKLNLLFQLIFSPYSTPPMNSLPAL
jgi:hypothetical protein